MDNNIIQQNIGVSPSAGPRAQGSTFLSIGTGLDALSGSLANAAKTEVNQSANEAELAKLDYQQRKILEQQDNENAINWINSSSSKTNLDVDQMFTDLQDTAPAGAPEFVPTFAKKFHEYAQQAITNAPDYAKKLYGQHLDNLYSMYGQKAIAFQHTAILSDRATNYTNNVDTAALQVAKDPSLYEYNKEYLKQTIPDIGPEGTTKAYDYMEKKLKEGWAEGIIRANPEAALRAFSIGDTNQPTDKPVISTNSPSSAGLQTPNTYFNQVIKYAENSPSNSVSPKGAKGDMQVMADTATDPGYGVAPAKNNSIAELERVGNDYSNALLAKYGDPITAAVAYNWGPGNADKWIENGSNPAQLPKETQKYIARVQDFMQKNPNSVKVASATNDMQGIDMPNTQPDDLPKTGTPIDDYTLDERLHYAQQADQQIRANHVGYAQQRQQANDALNAAQDKVQQDFLSKVVAGTLTPQMVLDDKVLDAGQKEHWVNAINTKISKPDKTDPDTFIDVFNRIHAPSGDPTAITSPDQLYPYMGNGLSFTDIGKMRLELEGKNQPSGDLLSKFKQMAKSQISGTTMIANDKSGDQQFYNWNAYFDDVYAQKLREGKTSNDLLQPTSKDYLGTTINSYIRNPQQQLNDYAKTISSGQTINGVPNVTPRKKGESVESYLKRTGVK